MNNEKSLSLHDRTAELERLYKRLMETGGDLDEPIDGQAIGDLIQKHELLHRTKIDILCWVLITLEKDVETCKEHAKRLTERAKAKTERMDMFKDTIRESMARLGILKVVAPENTVWRQKNGKAPLDVFGDTDSIPDRFIRTEIIRTPDREAIRAALEAGDAEAQKFARLGEVTESLRIR